jgi:hypothetical protein
MASPVALHSVVLAQAGWAFGKALIGEMGSAALEQWLEVQASEIAVFVQRCRSPPPGQLPTLIQPSSDNGTTGIGPRE